MYRDNSGKFQQLLYEEEEQHVYKTGEEIRIACDAFNAVLSLLSTLNQTATKEWSDAEIVTRSTGVYMEYDRVCFLNGDPSPDT